MCGRFLLKTGRSPDAVAECRPTDRLPTVVVNGDGRPQVEEMVWGFVPRWGRPKESEAVINARLETIDEKPYFRDAVQSRRCRVPMEQFWEWRKIPGSKKKQKCRIGLKDRGVFSVAGVWEEGFDPRTGELRRGFAIVTQAATGSFLEIHDRIPVILSKEEERIWLGGPVTEALAYFRRRGAWPSEDLLITEEESAPSPQADFFV